MFWGIIIILFIISFLLTLVDDGTKKTANQPREKELDYIIDDRGEIIWLGEKEDRDEW